LILLEKLLKIEVFTKEFHDEESLRNGILWAKQKGLEVVIGGVKSMLYANEFGMKFEQIKVSSSSIRATFDSARSVIFSSQIEREKTERYKTILDSVFKGIIVTDQNMNITEVNNSAKQLLKIKRFLANKPQSIL